MPLVEFEGELCHWDMVERGLNYWGLRDWWLSTFSEDEREYIERVDLAAEVGARGVIDNDDILYSFSRRPKDSQIIHEDLVYFLDLLKTKFFITRARQRNKLPYFMPKDQSIVDRIKEKADELRLKAKKLRLELGLKVEEDEEPEELTHWDLYGSYVTMFRTAYGARKTDPTAVSRAIKGCENAIALAPELAEEYRREYHRSLPGHEGYTQLAMIRERQQEYAEVIRLATEAKEQGWDGDWDKRIERCKKKIQYAGGKAYRLGIGADTTGVT